MAEYIIPSGATSTLIPRFAFYDSTPDLFGLDDELRALMELYIAYLRETTGEYWALGDLAQGLTIHALGEEDTWDFWGWISQKDGDEEPTNSFVPSTWPLKFTGFDRDVEWTINQWASYNAEKGCPISSSDVVRGMTFMLIDDDKDFRTWRMMRVE